MAKFFNTAGPCNNEDHYMLPALERCQDLMPLINRKQYFVIHAARQTGKTTLLRSLVKELNLGNKYYALYCSLESIQGIKEPKEGIPAIVQTIGTAMEFASEFEHELFNRNINYSETENVLYKSLARYCKSIDKPMVIMFDEVDCLSNGTLVSFLRQIRNGYVQKDTIPFVHSLALVGMRNIRDYKAKVRDKGNTLGSASPFNIVTESFSLQNFTKEETASLLHQHSENCEQKFPQKIIDQIYYYSQGQPWLVNAIAREIVDKILAGDYSKKITPPHVEKAVQNIILRRDTHIDSLLERLKEERVRKVVEPMLIGKTAAVERLDDDLSFAQDLGLVKIERGVIKPANPIYAEIMGRMLSYQSQMDMLESNLGHDAPHYLEQDTLDVDSLLKDFQVFWRNHSAIWKERYQYKEAAPHLILQAFLQRVLNGGGQLVREFATGSGRVDLCMIYKRVKYPIEIKLHYDKTTIPKGIEQLSGYMNNLGCKKGWLVVFNRDQDLSWDEKIFWKDVSEGGLQIGVAGC